MTTSIITTMTIMTTSIITTMTIMTTSIIMSMTTIITSTIMSMTRTAPCGCHDHDHHHHHHHADEVFTSWGKETVRKFSRAEIEEILKTLSEDSSYGVILRAKGMLEDENGTWDLF